ncbi:MAG: hypothetical protein R3F47_07140 [Gammaproteobacteria bacterium]
MKLNQTLTTLLLCGAALPAMAAQWQTVVDAEYAEQSFDAGDADLYTLTVSPALHSGQWTFSATLPWQKINGTYFVNTRNTNLAFGCEQLSRLSDLQQLVLINRGTISADQLSTCTEDATATTNDASDSVSGLGDIELFANRYLSPMVDQLSGSIGMGYKLDTGDYKEGLGTGTQDIYLETSWLYDMQALSVLFTLGYEFLLSNDTDLDLQDYGYMATDLRWHATEVIAVGGEYQFQQTSLDGLDDVDFITGYVQFGRATGWGVRLFVTDYLGGEGLPDQEIGGNLSYVF